MVLFLFFKFITLTSTALNDWTLLSLKYDRWRRIFFYKYHYYWNWNWYNWTVNVNVKWVLISMGPGWSDASALLQNVGHFTSEFSTFSPDDKECKFRNNIALKKWPNILIVVIRNAASVEPFVMRSARQNKDGHWPFIVYSNSS